MPAVRNHLQKDISLAKSCIFACEAAVELLQSRVGTLREHLPAARSQDVEGIHDMRVASRRLRAFLKEHRKLFDAKIGKRFGRRARTVTRALGPSRELDVTIGLLLEVAAAFESPAREAAEHILMRLRVRRQESVLGIREGIRAVEAPAFDENLVALCVSLREPATCYLDTAKDGLKRAHKQLLSAYDAWKESRAEEDLHQVRICFKKLRYTCELYEPLYGSEMKDRLKALKGAQEALGDWNDVRVLRDYVQELSEGAPEEAAAGVPALCQVLESKAEALLSAFGDDAHAFFAPERVEEIRAYFGAPSHPCCEGAVRT
jgi:CHAD domain-containing protein